jgi:hypothetical protein
MPKKHFVQLFSAIRRLEKRGVIGKDASSILQDQKKVLKQAIASKNRKMIKRAVAKISQIFNQELER